MSGLIPLTNESVEQMYDRLYTEFGYEIPNFYDNPEDYNSLYIDIFLDEDDGCIYITHYNHPTGCVKTWDEWDHYVDVVMPPMFGFGGAPYAKK